MSLNLEKHLPQEEYYDEKQVNHNLFWKKTVRQVLKVSVMQNGNYSFEFTPVLSGTSYKTIGSNNVIIIKREHIEEAFAKAEQLDDGSFGVAMSSEKEIFNRYWYSDDSMVGYDDYRYGKQQIYLKFNQEHQLTGAKIDEAMCVTEKGKTRSYRRHELLTKLEDKPRTIFVASDLKVKPIAMKQAEADERAQRAKHTADEEARVKANHAAAEHATLIGKFNF